MTKLVIRFNNSALDKEIYNLLKGYDSLGRKNLLWAAILHYCAPPVGLSNDQLGHKIDQVLLKLDSLGNEVRESPEVSFV